VCHIIICPTGLAKQMETKNRQLNNNGQQRKKSNEHERCFHFPKGKNKKG